MTPLAAIIAARIRATGPISLAEYMQVCLMDSRHGYYATRDPFGTAGDFTTAPEIHQMFGELCGLALAQTWLDQGAPAPFALVELPFRAYVTETEGTFTLPLFMQQAPHRYKAPSYQPRSAPRASRGIPDSHPTPDPRMGSDGSPVSNGPHPRRDVPPLPALQCIGSAATRFCCGSLLM